jgi:hypothetical protein
MPVMIFVCMSKNTHACDDIYFYACDICFYEQKYPSLPFLSRCYLFA